MTDEIKEILEELEDCKITKHLNYSLDNKDARIILDYITNLQEELEEQKRIEEADFNLIQDLEDTIIDKKECIEALDTSLTNLQEENEKVHKELDYADNYNIYLISRIDKAVEYIEQNIEDEYKYDGLLYKNEDKEKLINILKGEDKE